MGSNQTSLEFEDHWRPAINERTKDFLETNGVLAGNLRAYHWDGRSSTILGSIRQGRLEIEMHDSGERLSFASIDDFISAGWAVSGEAIRFYKGDHYGQPSNIFGGIKFLVLGESTHSAEYSVGDAPFHETNQGVANHVAGENYRFHSGVTTVLSNKASLSEIEPEQRKSIWESVAFSNVIPVVAAEYGRQKIPDCMFNLCSPFLIDLFDELEPEVVMVFGARAWKWLHWGLVNGRSKWQQGEPPVWIKGAACGFTNHPSGGMSYKHAKKMRDDLLTAARSRP